MLNLNSDDIALLYDKLVILPVDRKDKSESEIKKAQPDTTRPKIKVPSQVEDATTKPEPINKTLNDEVISHPFVVLTTSDLKVSLANDASNFRKIIKALEISQVVKYLQSVDSLDLTKHQYNCIWCIGLSAEDAANIKAKHAKKILFSPNMETLKTKEEKIAMFSPLKEFISSNLGLLSKL